jgi:hypothetical protein
VDSDEPPVVSTNWPGAPTASSGETLAGTGKSPCLASRVDFQNGARAERQLCRSGRCPFADDPAQAGVVAVDLDEASFFWRA